MKFNKRKEYQLKLIEQYIEEFSKKLNHIKTIEIKDILSDLTRTIVFLLAAFIIFYIEFIVTLNTTGFLYYFTSIVCTFIGAPLLLHFPVSLILTLIDTVEMIKSYKKNNSLLRVAKIRKEYEKNQVIDLNKDNKKIQSLNKEDVENRIKSQILIYKSLRRKLQKEAKKGTLEAYLLKRYSINDEESIDIYNYFIEQDKKGKTYDLKNIHL